MREILPVYAVIATVIFVWSLVTFFWKLPSWLFFLTVGEILTILAYTLAFDLLESLVWLGAFLLLAFLLPPVVLRNRFAERGSIVGLVLLGSIALFIMRYSSLGPAVMRQTSLWVVVTLLLGTTLIYLSTRIQAVSDVVLAFTDRLIVFLFLFVPLGVVSSLVVLLRNLT
jgi:hypothetical protein